MKKIIIILISLFLIAAVLLIPTFYFNKLELKGRPIYSSIESAKQAAYDNIEQRSGREGGTKSTEEYDYYSSLITENLNKMDSYISKHQKILESQDNFIFLLPSKYKNFYSQKKESLDKYYLSLRDFKQLKESESAIMNSFMMSSTFSTTMTDIGNTKEVSIDYLKEVIGKFKTSQINLKDNYDKGYLTETLYKKLSSDLNYFINSFTLTIDWMEERISSDEFGNKFKEMSANTTTGDVVELISESRTKITNVKAEEWKNLYDQALELSNKALEYYDENKLADDNLSKIISIFNKNYPQSRLTKSETEVEEKYVDLDGDGQQDILRLSIGDRETENPSVTLVAYDKDNKEIGRLPDDFPIMEPMSETTRVYTPIKKDKNQFVSFEFMAGPHSSQTMFFGLFEFKDGSVGILPVCLTDDVEGATDCLFWSGEVGELVVDDFDKDGILEVVEMVDEYPKDGPITEDIKTAVGKTFDDLGQKASDGALRVLKREQGGRGNRVIWGIYKYNDSYFEKQLDKNYDKYYVLVKDHITNLYPNYPTIMKKSEMSKDSLEYNEFMRNYWTGNL